MTTLTEFLLSRIAEDEAAARAATPGPWRYNPAKINSVDLGEAVFTGPRGLAAITIASTGPADDPASMSDANHIARHDPARVLAECEVKRQIVWECQRFEEDAATFDHLGAFTDAANSRDRADLVRRLAVAPLASLYAAHPDYRQEWRNA